MCASLAVCKKRKKYVTGVGQMGGHSPFDKMLKRQGKERSYQKAGWRSVSKYESAPQRARLWLGGLHRNSAEHSLGLLQPKGSAFLVWTLPDVGRGQAALGDPLLWVPGVHSLQCLHMGAPRWAEGRLQVGSIQSHSEGARASHGQEVAVVPGCSPSLRTGRGGEGEGLRVEEQDACLQIGSGIFPH